jgi:hypothetical protein
MTVKDVLKQIREEFKDSRLCGDECELKKCDFEPCHCPYGIERQAEIAEIRREEKTDESAFKGR